jgi:molecular chaperone GrpE (heat shock protein)
MTEAGEMASAALLDELTAALHRLGEGQDQLREQLERVDLASALAGLSEDQRLLRTDFERLAGHVSPLLARQYQDSDKRIRALEAVIRNRRERPLIARMAQLLGDVRRLNSAADVKTHVEESLIDLLTGLGYQETGSVGEPFDPGRHEPVSGSTGKAGTVTHVHRHGLACQDDVIIRAHVDVEPVAGTVIKEGGADVWEA